MATKIKPGKKQHVQHIQVFTRVRPISSQELRSPIVVECLSSKEVSVRDKTQTKTFCFDKVFGPDSRQVDVYKAVVNPLIAEVLQGYNCTVFAYGQTGTGKTYTMVGDKTDETNKNWEDEPRSGIIPRALSHLFDELKVRAEEFTVRVSFLELYNEELCDLLAPNDNDEGKTLKLFEDSMKRGSVIVSGLEERTVHNKDDVYAILEAGNLKRQTAYTLMNAQSSRSHTIFTITVHIKVTTPEGEDLIKTGKLNLVDLAGSENIGRSGAVDMRAREAGNINQSLLTLGRVITSLVERTPHIPYRESKLTRILQDSLGGRTQTSIIATVSPALINIEETLSTLEYAHRARNITNKPEINQKTSKRVLLTEYTKEIERLRRDLIAAREKHGVYLASENYDAIMAERENLNKELVSKIQLLKVREEELMKQEEILQCLNATRNQLTTTSEQLKESERLCSEKEETLNELTRETSALLKTTEEAIRDARSLHDRLDRSRRIQDHNMDTTEKFKNNFCTRLSEMKSKTKEFHTTGINDFESQIEFDKELINNFVANQNTMKDTSKDFINKANGILETFMSTYSDQTNSTEKFLQLQLEAGSETMNRDKSYAQNIISEEMEYSNRLSHCQDQLREKIEEIKEPMMKLGCNIQEVEMKSKQRNRLISELTGIVNEKLKEKENHLQNLFQECEELENVRLELRKKEEECEESLKILRNKMKCQYSNIFKEVTEDLKGANNADNNHLEETEKITSRMTESTEKAIDELKNKIIPLLNTMTESQEEWSDILKSVVNAFLKEKENDHEIMRNKMLVESEKVNICSNQVHTHTKEMKQSFENFDKNIQESFCHQIKSATTSLSDSIIRKQNLAAKIREHSEKLFSNLHDRMKEIEVFFTEGIKRDEKTGNTPQRKEFSYPKRLLNFTNKRKESSRYEKDGENKSFDAENLADYKENIIPLQ